MSKPRPRLFCSDLINGDFLYAVRFAYTGEWQYRTITTDGERYRLVTLLSDGLLTFLEPYVCDMWMCGGGGGGEAGGYTFNGTSYAPYPGKGGSGGYCAFEFGIELGGQYNVLVGKGGKRGEPNEPVAGRNPPTPGGATSLGGLIAEGGTIVGGGSGGGGWHYDNGNTWYPIAGGEGAGISTLPFGDDLHFDLHCAGGAGGNYKLDGGTRACIGGDGGSDGANGNPGKTGPSSLVLAVGGERGGGNGSFEDVDPVRDATYPGAGGAGGYCWAKVNGIQQTYGGHGADGIVYIRVPF